MSFTQFILICVIVAIAAYALKALRGEKSLAVKRIFALFVAFCGVIAIIFPQTLSLAAHALGIGRGTDLLLYLAIIAGMIFCVAVIRAKARSDARTTRLARAVALMDARDREAVVKVASQQQADTK